MTKICLIVLLFIIKTLSSFSLENIKIETLSTAEQAQKVAPLYIQYYKESSLTEKEFLERWQVISQNSDYCMLIAYDKNFDEEAVGFIDGTVFPTLFQGAIMRIDSVYIDEKFEETDNEKEIYLALYNKIETFAKAKGVKEIHTNSGDVYKQERRLFATTLELVRPEKSAFFRKNF